MRCEELSSWGNVKPSTQAILTMHHRSDDFPGLGQFTHALPYGNGRSYGDSCLNSDGAALMMRSLRKFVRFDRDTGLLTCEAGVLLSEILAICIPSGWFLPVTPGTQFVTLGGAIANDVHGKNHHREGTFGCHILQLDLLRSDGTRMYCSPSVNADWFSATIGGLGLTGVIVTATIQLRRIASGYMEVHVAPFAGIEEFLRLCEVADVSYEYTVAWLDTASHGRRLGRGVFQSANHSPASTQELTPDKRPMEIRWTPPVSVIGMVPLRLFNEAYYRWQIRQHGPARRNYKSFFYPLDGIGGWNRLYGRKGFYQYQCVIPTSAGPAPVTKMLAAIAKSGIGSRLAVLKKFGALRSPGLMSFPLPGLTLAADFENRGKKTEALFAELDNLVADAGGRLYPAKDQRMPASLFARGYARVDEFSRYLDPRMSSSFWRRVAAAA
jgi:FAD/FMN-containing dehydrogenase